MDSVTYNVSRTINLGNYESIKVEIGETRDVPEVFGDSDMVYQDIVATVNARLAAFVKHIKSKEKAK